MFISRFQRFEEEMARVSSSGISSTFTGFGGFKWLRSSVEGWIMRTEKVLSIYIVIASDFIVEKAQILHFLAARWNAFDRQFEVNKFSTRKSPNCDQKYTNLTTELISRKPACLWSGLWIFFAEKTAENNSVVSLNTIYGWTFLKGQSNESQRLSSFLAYRHKNIYWTT